MLLLNLLQNSEHYPEVMKLFFIFSLFFDFLKFSFGQKFIPLNFLFLIFLFICQLLFKERHKLKAIINIWQITSRLLGREAAFSITWINAGLIWYFDNEICPSCRGWMSCCKVSLKSKKDRFVDNYKVSVGESAKVLLIHNIYWAEDKQDDLINYFEQFYKR